MSKTTVTLEKENVGKSAYAFSKLNNIVGWSVFAIATTVYLLTLERTASFWDCGEFIACSYKLQVPHPPGAPFFLLVGRMFSLLALGNVEMVAFWINVSSALCSGFTILFLFWSITRLGIRLYPNRPLESQLTEGQILTLMLGGTIGALAYTFSDSFWFSAVEAEVYAMSSFFTAFVFWAILKWELIEDASAANRWLILIAYMVGLSIGVHLLNLVVVPAMALIYYYKQVKNPNLIGVVASLALSLVIILFIMEGIIPGLPALAGNFEVTFVNSFGLPVGVGAITVIVLVIGSVVFGVAYTERKQMVTLNTVLLSLTFILIGYLSYGIIPIRANYNPPINENDPSDIIKFVSYLKREQYGDRPLLWGPTFNSQMVGKNEKGYVYRYDAQKKRYVVAAKKYSYTYDNEMFLPRLYSSSENHTELYMKILYGNREMPQDYIPTSGDNLKFMLNYQMGHMYWRYFLWNFVGREGDAEGSGVYAGLGNEKDLPHEKATSKARNSFLGLPLILGILGFIYMFARSRQTTFVTAMLFFMTGLALVIYLNSPPTEPRERDYIYVGSFYVFAMWIGFGAMALAQLFSFERNLIAQAFESLSSQKRNENAWHTIQKSSQWRGIVGSAIVGIGTVFLMAQQGWDDHNRSNRYHSIDSAKNLLNSCAPNAILFTGGDNDTFPLWYVQEVEGFRTDVRVCNLSLLGTDWYIQQMKRKAYESAPLPLSIPESEYLQGKNDQIAFVDAKTPLSVGLSAEKIAEMNQKGLNLATYIQLIKQGDPRMKASFAERGIEEITIIPSKKMVYEFNAKEIAKKMGLTNLGDTESATKMNEIEEKIMGIYQDALRNMPDSLKARYTKTLPDLPADKEAKVMELRTELDKYRRKPQITGTMEWNLPSNSLFKNDLAILDMIVTNNWERPIYFANTLGSTSYLGLKEYLQLEGLAFRLMPFKRAGEKEGFVNTKIMYENMTKKFHWRELNNANAFYEENYQRFAYGVRTSAYRLAFELLEEEDKEKAKQVANFIMDKIPDKAIPYDNASVHFVEIYFKVGEKKKAMDLAETLRKRFTNHLNYIQDKNIEFEVTAYSNLNSLLTLANYYKNNGEEKLAEACGKDYQRFRNQFMPTE